jgi:hypothetical protein
MSVMKRQRRRSAANKGTQAQATSPDGPLRRRQTLRHLHSLAQELVHEPNPTTATAHVRVLDGPGSSDPGAAPAPVVMTGRVPEPAGPPTPEVSTESSLPPSDRVRAVPIDQPLRVSP